MAVREFTITELRRNADGGYTDTPVRFVWTNDARSAPRGSWRFGVQTRSVREDYPGAEEPVEQVLGPNYKDFTLQGVWDDRYNTPGYALTTMRAMEALVQRGTLCRFEFETVALVGLPKDLDFDYKRADYIGYSFTVSPHYRTTGSANTGTTVRRKAPEAMRPITESRDQAVSNAAAMETNQEEVMSAIRRRSLAANVVGTPLTDNRGILDQLHQGVADLVNAVEWRVDAGQDFFVDLKRVANSLNVIKNQSAAMITSVASLKSSVYLAYDNAVDALDFDVYRTSMSGYARKLGLLGAEGRDELSRRVEPKAVALYRPRKDESLYSISQRFYGTPTGWQQIATRNGLTTVTLQGTELLIIPERR
jgi:hypothetical protein